MRRYNPYKLFVGSMIPNWLMRRTEISANSKLLFARICQYAGEDGEAYPSQVTLAKELGMPTRNMQRALEELRKNGLIEAKRRGAGRSNGYIFLTHEWMEEPEIGASVAPQVAQEENQLRESNKEKGATLPFVVDTPTRKKTKPQLPYATLKFEAEWRDWCEYRNACKKKMSEKTVEKQLKMLSEWGEEAAIEAINKSITSGWLGLFDPRKRNKPDQEMRVSGETLEDQMREQEEKRKSAKTRI